MPVETSEAVRIYMDKHKEDGNIPAPGNTLNQIKTSVSYDSKVGDSHTANADKAQRETVKLPGTFWDHQGTTCYNPLRTDPRVEAILGERKYKEQISKDSPDDMKLKIEQLAQQVATLTALLGQKVKEPEEPEVITEPAKPDYENMKYYDLLTVVQSMYPELRGKPKKDNLLEMIRQKEEK